MSSLRRGLSAKRREAIGLTQADRLSVSGKMAVVGGSAVEHGEMEHSTMETGTMASLQ